jgi:DeoR/GlpR family transcriptional regulator of sugar metabolism
MNNNKQKSVPLHDRQTQIAELLATHGECRVEALAERFGVSEMTIRRDLQALNRVGRVIRTHGGAAPADRVTFEFKFLEKTRSNQEAKEAIAARAASIVEDGQSVLLDSGTTTLPIARRLRARKNLTVITTSLPIASLLQYSEHVQVLLLGGYLQRGSPDLIGAMTEANLEVLRADVAFIGADAIDRNANVYNHSLEVGRMLSKMAESAKRVFVVADRSKFGQTALMRFGNLAEWDGFITDAGVDTESAAALKRAGVNLIEASPIGNGKS